MRFWAKIINRHRVERDTVIEDYGTSNRTKKVTDALQAACAEFDLPVPMWLDVNIRDFQRTAKVRFGPDSFGEPVNFQSFEFQVIEEDY
jgi:hypothetical protein